MLTAGYCDAIMAHWRLATPALVRAVRDAGGELYVWTVDELPRILELEGLGVTGVITNDPRCSSSWPALTVQGSVSSAVRVRRSADPALLGAEVRRVAEVGVGCPAVVRRLVWPEQLARAAPDEL